MRLPFLAPTVMIAATAAVAEVTGEDHPLLPRYEGAEIRAYSAPSQDQVIIPTSRVGDEKAAVLAKPITGTVTHIDYVRTSLLPWPRRGQRHIRRSALPDWKRDCPKTWFWIPCLAGAV